MRTMKLVDTSREERELWAEDESDLLDTFESREWRITRSWLMVVVMTAGAALVAYIAFGRWWP